ncbi:MAG: hypothetical protein IKP95_09230 [Ruminococcus sp.]|nr:hypothetical protein [Ruminococcus sp.]
MAENVTAVLNVPMAKEETELSTKVSGIEFEAESIVVNSPESFEEAGNLLKQVKKMAKNVVEFFKPMKEQAHKAHAAICERENEMKKPLTKAEKVLKESMGRFAEEQERKRREEAERARLEAERLAKEKLAEAIAADENGDAEASAMAMLDAEYAERSASQPVVLTPQTKVEGISTKKDYEIVSIDEDKVPCDVNGMVIRPVDKAAVLRLIKASKGKIKIEGVTYRETVSLSVRT